MKNKKITIIFLLIAVALVWGIIIWKIFGKTEIMQVHKQVTFEERALENTQEEAYELFINYGNPFEDRQYKKEINTKKKTSAPKSSKPAVQWPSIKFNGYLCGNGAEKVHLLYNGKSLILTEGTKVEKIVMEKIDKDSVLIRYENEKKWFFK